MKPLHYDPAQGEMEVDASGKPRLSGSGVGIKWYIGCYLSFTG